MSDHGQYRVPLLLQIALLLSLPTGGFISRRRVVIIDVGIVVVVFIVFAACLLSLPQRLSPHRVVALQTGFVCGMCTSVCCCRRLLQQPPPPPLAVIRAGKPRSEWANGYGFQVS